MRTCVIKWLAGIVAFLLPALVTLVGLQLDHSHYRNDPIYKSAIPPICVGAIILSVIVPSTLALMARISLFRRVCFVALVWGGLVLENYILLIIAMSGKY